MVAACLWEIALARLDLERTTDIPDDGVLAEALTVGLDRLGSETIDECWSEYRVKPTIWRTAPPGAEALASLAEEAPRWLGTPSEMAAVLAAAGAPTRFSELDPPIDRDTATWAVANAHFLRGRFTVLDLVLFTGGNIRTVVEDAFERAAEAGGGCVRLVDRFAGFVFDLDGTVYLDDVLLPGAAATLAAVRDREAPHVFVTNKPLERSSFYAGLLRRLEVPAADSQVVSSLDALVLYLALRVPGAKILCVYGTAGDRSPQRTGV